MRLLSLVAAYVQGHCVVHHVGVGVGVGVGVDF
jgi:hypothetical protein